MRFDKFNIGDKISILLYKRETATVIYKDVANEQILCHLKSDYGWKTIVEVEPDKVKQACNKYKNIPGSFWWVCGDDIKLIQRCADILDIE